MVDLFSKIQVKYRSDRFSKVGKRFGTIEHNPDDELQRERQRAHHVDGVRQRHLRNALLNTLTPVD